MRVARNLGRQMLWFQWRLWESFQRLLGCIAWRMGLPSRLPISSACYIRGLKFAYLETYSLLRGEAYEGGV